MALHLNLYHEIHRQAERERRDPFKIAMLLGVIVVIFMSGWYFRRHGAVSALQRQARALQSTWGAVEPELKKSETSKESALARQKAHRTLVEYLRGRFYWGPVLGQIADVTPANVQLVSVSGELQEKDGKKNLSLYFKGIAAGDQPRTAAEEFRKALQEKFAAVYGDASALFDANSLEDAAETVTVNGQTLGTATFRINVKFSVAAPSPPPAPAAKKANR